MWRSLFKTSPLARASLCSLLAHILFIFSMRILAQHDFGAAVNLAAAVSVDLAPASAAPAATGQGLPDREGPAVRTPAPAAAAPRRTLAGSSVTQLPERFPPAPEPALPGTRSESELSGSEHEPERDSSEYRQRSQMAYLKRRLLLEQPKPQSPPADAVPAPGRPAARREAAPGSAIAGLAAAEGQLAPELPAGCAAMLAGGFLSARYEKLRYLVSIRGVPVANAELESKNDQGVTTITLRVRSNPAVSGLFPVQNEIETRHVEGRFIMTRIRQREGSFNSDESFTINLRKKSVRWAGSHPPRTLELTLPSHDLLDTLSGIYYLRSRPLQVGSTETLHIFDSESYAEVPVTVLRREETRLANLDRVATLVLRPERNTAGIFRRTGDLLIWMTDDDFKVPVRIVTSSALGQVTAELVSAQSQSHREQEVASLPPR